MERAIKLIGFVFEDAFLGNFFPCEKREANIKKLIKFEIGIHECAKYNLKFTKLSRYAPQILADMRRRMNLFVSGLAYLLSKEGKAVSHLDPKPLMRPASLTS